MQIRSLLKKKFLGDRKRLSKIERKVDQERRISRRKGLTKIQTRDK